MGEHNGIIYEIRKGLERCGYTGEMLQTNYPFQNGDLSIIPLVGFESAVQDSRSSCICVLAQGDAEEVEEEYINSYRRLGAPVIFVDCGSAMQWWGMGASGANYIETIEAKNLNVFFSRKSDELAPKRIWRAKNLGRIHAEQQLSFVDIGLMPLIEEEMGEQLGRLMTRVIGLLRRGFTADQLEQPNNQQWIFRAAFWVLCAKILKDKEVPRFIRLNLGDLDAVLGAVRTHYGASQPINAGTREQRRALERAAEEVSKHASLATLTTEAFGYMYENVLVDKKLRSALGIHATPSYLVDYIIWQLWPWIEKIPPEKRVVLEPACGHAPFLTGAMRLLRELFEGEEKEFHEYAQGNLMGIERDSFAREIARLSLTMADVPNPNGWQILDGDIYSGDTLCKQAKTAAILLCNPPFENFKPHEQEQYKEGEQELKCFNKAAEMLWRTLPYMPGGSVFGVVLPYGFRDRGKLADLRKEILTDFEVQQICCLPKKVFRFANHESVVLTGRKKTWGDQHKVLWRDVPKESLVEFKDAYKGMDQYVLQSRFAVTPAAELKIIALGDIWDYCEQNMARLKAVADGGQGLVYKGRDLPEGTKTFEKTRFAGSVKGYALFGRNIRLHELPDEYWMNLSPEVIRRPMWGVETGRQQILMNYAPISAEPWRIKALIDNDGHPVTSRFLAFRVKSDEWSVYALWAILNSPLANAFIYAHTTDRDIETGIARKIPVPVCSRKSLEGLKRLVVNYLTLMERRDSGFGIDVREEAKHLLLCIDAEVMRLYDLPPKMEKRVLDLFQGVQRKGVDFEFTGYYTEGFESAVPLHEYLSEEYQRSTIEFADEWVRKHRSSEIDGVLRTAVEAFGE
ncbi:MAG: N-6 DNA methylase [Sedimentisphaerales bacterium]|nr:N-6 DNA methylase [Sedimentisphaerales bacterium]